MKDLLCFLSNLYSKANAIMMADDEEKKEDDAPEGEGAEAAEGDGEGGDGDAEGEEGEEGESKGGLDTKKLILFVGVPLLILVGVGAGLYFSGFLDSMLGKKIEYQMDEHGELILDEHGEPIPVEHEEEDHGDDHGKKKKKKGDGHGDGHGDGYGESAFLEIPPMIVNLNSPDGNPRYLRLSVQLELADPSESGDVEAVMPRVVDQFQTYLRELRVKDLRGSAGIYRLQMELLWRVNQAAAPVEIKDVLFQEILIQ